MTQIRVPTAFELRERLDGIDQLLTARRWERAAIVYAFTEVQTNKGHGTRPGVSAGKWNLQDFAQQGFAGLTTPKAVRRYREAWIKAIEQGWAAPVEPGQSVNLPDERFPKWEDTSIQSTATVSDSDGITHISAARSYNRRPVNERIVDHLNSLAKSLGRLAEMDLTPEERADLVEKLNELQRQTAEVIRSLRGLVSV